MTGPSAVKPIFHGIPRKAIAGNNLGSDIVLGRNGSISREKIEQAGPIVAGASFPEQSLHKILARRAVDQTGDPPNRPDILVKIPIPYMPAGIARGLEAAGLLTQVEENCSGVVVCSHISRLGEYRSGFVIDGKYVVNDLQEHGALEALVVQEDPLPPFFRRSEINNLAAGFLDNPYQTIFINGFYEDGQMRSGLGFLHPLIIDLGYLIFSHDSPGLTYVQKYEKANDYFTQILRGMGESIKRELLALYQVHRPGK